MYYLHLRVRRSTASPHYGTRALQLGGTAARTPALQHGGTAARTAALQHRGTAALEKARQFPQPNFSRRVSK
jgi:hypothetical protein